ncbi:helix-turn-helix domain-containing protein [Paenibacillus sp. HJGM_3]|uniref:AraC family transcriptional regulator n=1 Tax=Paenibacillus sp. HJGM_3 TaxID=3379816 RepID=UPI00385AB9B5
MFKRYMHLNLKEELVVRRLYSFHYSELTRDYSFPSETHDFWEFVYVDKGSVEITTDTHVYQLNQGEMVFYAPNEGHALRTFHESAPNLFIICFDCRSDAMQYFANKTFRIGNEERRILSRLIEEGRRSFIPSTRKPKRTDRLLHCLEKATPSYFGSEQLVKIYLEGLLIQLTRNGIKRTTPPMLTSMIKQKEEIGIPSRLEAYIANHWSVWLTLERVCADFAMSKTYLGSVFRRHFGCGIIEFAGRIKIEKAKQFLREETCTVSEISERLGYSSIHYFSRHFKRATGMSPTEYLKTLKAIVVDQPQGHT